MYVNMVRTTLLLDEHLIFRIKNLAHAQDQTMTHVVHELLSEGLAKRSASKKTLALPLLSFDLGRPRVNLADREALEAVMEKA